MKINETYLKSIQPIAKKQEILVDNNLYFVVQPTGGKSWAYRYTKGDGKRAKVVLGKFPAMSLTEAKRQSFNKADELRNNALTVIEQKKLDIKNTEASQKTLEKEQFLHENGIFSVICDNFFKDAFANNKSKKNTHDQKRRVTSNVNSVFGHKNINEIEILDIKKAVDIIVARERYETASRVLDLVKRIFQYSRTLHLLSNERAYIINDIIDLKKFIPKPKVVHLYKKHLSENEIAELLRKIEGSKHRWTIPVSVAFRLMPYTFLRDSELSELEWSEVDTDKKCLRIRAERMKNGKEHVVPLSSQAQALIEEIGQFTANSKYVFNSRDDKPIAVGGIRMCLRRLGYQSIKNDENSFTTHSFRGMASSILHQNLKFNSDLVELQMAHIEEGSVKSSYNRLGPFAMFEERADMMQKYADYLDSLRDKTN